MVDELAEDILAEVCIFAGEENERVPDLIHFRAGHLQTPMAKPDQGHESLELKQGLRDLVRRKETLALQPFGDEPKVGALNGGEHLELLVGEGGGRGDSQRSIVHNWRHSLASLDPGCGLEVRSTQYTPDIPVTI
jgi:hypothetical protein